MVTVTFGSYNITLWMTLPGVGVSVKPKTSVLWSAFSKQVTYWIFPNLLIVD